MNRMIPDTICLFLTACMAGYTTISTNINRKYQNIHIYQEFSLTLTTENRQQTGAI